MSLSYQDPSMSRDQATQLISTSNAESIVSALISIGLNEGDWKWAQDVCIEHLKNDNEEIVAASIVALAHIARRHEKLETEKAKAAFENAQAKHPTLAGTIADAWDDIEMFVTGD